MIATGTVTSSTSASGIMLTPSLAVGANRKRKNIVQLTPEPRPEVAFSEIDHQIEVSAVLQVASDRDLIDRRFVFGKSSDKQINAALNQFKIFAVKQNISYDDPEKIPTENGPEILSLFYDFMYKVRPENKTKGYSFSTWDKYSNQMKERFINKLQSHEGYHSSDVPKSITAKINQDWTKLYDKYQRLYRANPDFEFGEAAQRIRHSKQGNYFDVIVFGNKVLWENEMYFEQSAQVLDQQLGGRISEVN
jgi:hypothetical protein